MRNPKFKTEFYEHSVHGPIVSKWWYEYNKDFFNLDFVSDKGIVLLDGGVTVAVSWLYTSNSKACQIGWTMVSSRLGPRARVEALIAILEIMTNWALSLGFKYIQTFSNRSAISKTMEKMGYNFVKPHDFLILKSHEFKSHPISRPVSLPASEAVVGTKRRRRSTS